MALSYLEQENIITGNLRPPVIELPKLMALIAVDFALYIRDNYKEFDEVTYPNAEQYKSRILSLANAVLSYERNKNPHILNSMVRVFVGILAKTGYTYSQVEGADQTHWENFIKSADPNGSGYAGILEIFEHLAGVSKEGKTEYDSITP